MGFCPNRSTIDNTFIIRRVFEKDDEYKINLFNVFIDYIHAFNSIHRTKM